MARPSILGNLPPTEAEVNHALECCKAIPRIREELLAMEQEMSDIRKSLGTAESQNEQELYEFMLMKKEQKYQQKGAELEKLIRAIWAIPHANAKAAVVGFYLELLGDNPVRRTADLKMNFDFLVKDLYENEISRLMYVVRLEELRCRLIFSSEDRAWERYTRLREKGQQAAMPKVTSDESRKTLLKAITWKYDWIQQHKKQCFRFAEAVYARQMKDETSQSRFIEAFIQYAANLPEPNRRLLDEMYELAWYDIQLYPCSLEGKRLVKPWYDTKESGDGKC